MLTNYSLPIILSD